MFEDNMVKFVLENTELLDVSERLHEVRVVE